MNFTENENCVVSVVMPVKNVEDTIKESIDSILNQTLKNLELILVNDSSTDGTKGILNSYTASDHRVKIIDSTGQGICDAANLGIEQAKAPLIARMDADDISCPERLEKQLITFNKNPKLVLLGSYYRCFKDNGILTDAVTLPTTNNELQESIRCIPTFCHPATMARKEIIQMVGGYRKKFEGAEDHDLYLRLSRHGEIAVLPKFLLWYRLHSNQFSQVKKAQSIRASVAAIFCDMCAHQSLPDPSEFNKSVEELVLELLIHELNNASKISTPRLILCARAIRGLVLLPDFHDKLISLRKKIIFKLINSGQFYAAFSLWRRSRKKNWL